MLHLLRGLRTCIKNVSAVLVVIPDDQIDMPITIKIRQRSGARVPAFTTFDYFLRYVAIVGKGLWVSSLEECERSPAPVVNKNVHLAILVQVSRHATHRGHSCRVVQFW